MLFEETASPRVTHIIWTMLTNNEEYVNPPMIEVSMKDESRIEAPEKLRTIVLSNV